MTIIRVVGSGIAHAAPLTLVAGMGHAFYATQIGFCLPRYWRGRCQVW